MTSSRKRSTAIARAGWAIAATVATACGGDATGPQRVPPNTITFVELRSGLGHDLYIADADGDSAGATARPLTSDDATNYGPAWSRDGAELAFVSVRDTLTSLYAMRADGSRRRQLVTGIELGDVPSWSPDARRLVVPCTMRAPRFPSDPQQVCVLAADGSGLRQITSEITSIGPAAWSPVADVIAFGCPGPSPSDMHICTIAPDGSGRRQLTNGPTYDINPAWSPDGTTLAFVSARVETGPRRRLYFMNADGTNVRHVPLGISEFGHVVEVAWAADGRRLAVTVSIGNDYIIHVANADGTGLRRFTRISGAAFNPVWSPL
jgi:TolB protein